MREHLITDLNVLNRFWPVVGLDQCASYKTRKSGSHDINGAEFVASNMKDVLHLPDDFDRSGHFGGDV